MKLLIVDDFVPKVGKLVEVLIDAGVQRSAIDVVTTAMQARAKLREVAYDLVVLDLMLPVREDSGACPEFCVRGIT